MNPPDLTLPRVATQSLPSVPTFLPIPHKTEDGRGWLGTSLTGVTRKVDLTIVLERTRTLWPLNSKEKLASQNTGGHGGM